MHSFNKISLLGYVNHISKTEETDSHKYIDLTLITYLRFTGRTHEQNFTVRLFDKDTREIEKNKIQVNDYVSIDGYCDLAREGEEVKLFVYGFHIEKLPNPMQRLKKFIKQIKDSDDLDEKQRLIIEFTERVSGDFLTLIDNIPPEPSTKGERHPAEEEPPEPGI